MFRALLMIAMLASCERADKPSEPPKREPRDASVVIERPIDASTVLDDAALDALMAEANRAYDHLELDKTKTLANQVLALRPDSVRMLRLLTSVACLEEDQATAKKFYARLPDRDRAQMANRCARYGITLSGT